MVTESRFGQTGLNTKETGKTTRQTGLENSGMWMETDLKETESQTKQMAKGFICT